MRRIQVTDEGITVTAVIESLVSRHGKEMRPGATSIQAPTWNEISRVSISAMELRPAVSAGSR